MLGLNVYAVFNKSIFQGISVPCSRHTYLNETAHHMISKHWQTGPTFSKHMQCVDRHDDSLRLASVHHQDADPVVAEADGEVCHA